MTIGTNNMSIGLTSIVSIFTIKCDLYVNTFNSLSSRCIKPQSMHAAIIIYGTIIVANSLYLQYLIALLHVGTL